MGKEEQIQQLKSLLDGIKQIEKAKEDVSKAERELANARKRIPVRAVEFDVANKEKYISSRVGISPEKPKGIIKVAVPLYKSKMKEYEKVSAEYHQRYKMVEDDYENQYAEVKNKLDAEEREEILKAITDAEIKKTSAHTALDMLQESVDKIDIVDQKYKSEEHVSSFISYLQENRADSIKEAINLYYEEQHRKKMEEYVEEQLTLTKQAKEYAEQAANSAKEAAYSASEAVDRADEAYRRADEANDRADEAYRRADEAYFAAL